jgi:uncharacterized membrane protein
MGGLDQALRAESSMRDIGTGQWLMALSCAGLAVVTLVWGDLAMQWQPLPKGVPLRTLEPYLSAAILFGCGAGLLTRRFATAAGLVLALYWLGFALLHLPAVMTAPKSIGLWLGFCESSAIACGAWALVALQARRWSSPLAATADTEASRRITTSIYAACLIVFGLSHLVYLKITAGMVPGWIPAHPLMAQLTGFAHIAAGVALIMGVAPRLAMTLEAVMMLLFALLVQGTALAGDPSSRLQWTALFVSLPQAAAAFAVAQWIGGPLLAWRAPPQDH